MATLDDFLDDDEERLGFGRRTSRGGMVRTPHGRSRFWSPSDALSRQPWFGFPGGREGWLEWRQTGQVPLQAGESRPRQLTPEQADYYYRIPATSGDAVVPGIRTDVNPAMVQPSPPTTHGQQAGGSYYQGLIGSLNNNRPRGLS